MNIQNYDNFDSEWFYRDRIAELFGDKKLQFSFWHFFF